MSKLSAWMYCIVMDRKALDVEQYVRGQQQVYWLFMSMPVCSSRGSEQCCSRICGLVHCGLFRDPCECLYYMI